MRGSVGRRNEHFFLALIPSTVGGNRPPTVLRIGTAHHHGHRIPARSIPQLAALDEIVDRTVDLWREKKVRQHSSSAQFSPQVSPILKAHRKSQARQLGIGIINSSIGPIGACLVPNQATLIFGSHPMCPSTTALRLPRNQQYGREQRNRRKWRLTEHTVKLGGESRAIIALGNGARACQTGSQRDFFFAPSQCWPNWP